jgi:hypothetical protein
MDSERVREEIQKNAAEIVRLKSRIDETFARRSESAKKTEEWKQACEEFHKRYAGLAFPGGYRGNVLDRIVRGDADVMEAAVCFLEVRPYFFRSGYMFKDILRKCRKAPLSPEQAARLSAIEKRLLEWRKRKQAKKKRRK